MALKGVVAAAGQVQTAQGASAAGGAMAPAPPPTRATLNLGPWQAARQAAINDLKAFAVKVAATKHGTAGGVLTEINFIIKN